MSDQNSTVSVSIGSFKSRMGDKRTAKRTFVGGVAGEGGLLPRGFTTSYLEATMKGLAEYRS